MDDINIFMIGLLVTIFSLIGVIYTVIEFREMTHKDGHTLKKSDQDRS